MSARFLAAVLVVSGLLAACTTIHGVTPQYPKVGALDLVVPTVDNLTPVFRWTPAGELGATYDFVIYEGPEKPRIGEIFGSGYKLGERPGAQVYYREGLTQPEHRVERPLQPGTVYYWSVRVRRGQTVSDWSRFHSRACLPDRGPEFFGSTWWLSCSRKEYPFFKFKTPRAESPSTEAPVVN